MKLFSFHKKSWNFMQEAKGRERELARVRSQKNQALASLEKVAVSLGVFIPPGYTTASAGVEISKEEFLSSVQKMLQSEKLLPVAVIDDEKFADLSVFWSEEVSGCPQLRYQEFNLKGFVTSYQEIEKAVNKRGVSAKFVKSQIISSFCDDVANLIAKKCK
jgi:hypothetical protein